MAELGLEYSRGMALEVVQRYDRALAGVAAEGALVTSLSDEEKLKWINGLPDIAGRWVAAAERRGHPAASVLAAFMTEFRQRGGRPLRDWDAPRPTATAD
jgi:hypothetical protein